MLVRHKPLHVWLASACLLALAGSASAKGVQSGGAVYVPPPPPPKKATIVNGKAIAPAGAPRRVKRVIAAANRLVRKPYRYGGGHRGFASGLDSGYDCSGAVSYALHGGGFLRSPLASGALMRWGRPRPGRWITVYAHGGHAYVVVAGLRLDTAGGRGPRWHASKRSRAGFAARHPAGL